MGNNSFQTLWRLTEGNHDLESSIIAGLDKYIQRVRSGYAIEIQSWSGDELNTRRTTALRNAPIPGIATVPKRGRSQGQFKSQREEQFKKRTANNNNSNNICDVPVTGTTITTNCVGFAELQVISKVTHDQEFLLGIGLYWLKTRINTTRGKNS